MTDNKLAVAYRGSPTPRGQHSLVTTFLAGVMVLKSYYGHPDHMESEDAFDFFDRVTELAMLVGMLDREKPSPRSLAYIMRAMEDALEGYFDECDTSAVDDAVDIMVAALARRQRRYG
jgi:hypothetical protein